MPVGQTSGNAGIIQLFLRAKTADELVMLQIQNNMTDRIQYAYQIVLGPDKHWYAWYEKDLRAQLRVLKREDIKRTKIVKL